MLLSFLKSLNHNRWNIGFIDIDVFMSSAEIRPNCEIHWMKHNITERWFADPYILSVNDNEIVCLVEEMSYSINRGRIARLLIDRKDYTLKEVKIILDSDTHLSFPFVWRQTDGSVLIVPENGATGMSYCYSIDPSGGLVNKHEFFSEPLTDATINVINGKTHLLTTFAHNCNGKVLSDYLVEDGKVNVASKRDIQFDSEIARNAGAVFLHEGRYYRPAQDCSSGYGVGVKIQLIDNCEDGLRFTTVKELYPTSFKYNLGLHTFNVLDKMAVIDGRGLRYPIVGRIVRPIINLLKH